MGKALDIKKIGDLTFAEVDFGEEGGVQWVHVHKPESLAPYARKLIDPNPLRRRNNVHDWHRMRLACP